LLNDFGAARTDLIVEAIARAAMLGLAAFMLLHWPAGGRYEKQRALLFWGLIGFSLDVYWQVAYEGPAQWVAMAVKYLGVAGGLSCFIALAASFGDGDRLGVRNALARTVAPAFGVVLAAIGITHGYTWMQHCGIAIGDCYVNDLLSVSSFRAYFSVDALGRILTLVAALAGLLSSPQNRQRLLLITVSCAVLSIGTALDLSARLISPSPGYVFLVQNVDAATTLCFALGLFLALKRGLLFDVAYVISRGTVYLCSFIALLILVGAIEGSFHWGGVTIAHRYALDQIVLGGD
jgi:hypothetical protein